jgi:fructose-1,6-bisphosphatase/inositol monophosphatase family enzyme
VLPDPERVGEILRQVAGEEILPRFRRLQPHEVVAKSHPHDLVTTADVMAERRLTEALPGLVPGSVVVGEEGCEKDPTLLRALDGEAPAWLVDPVDGTLNFAHGNPNFAVIVAFCTGGETRMGWILEPVSGLLAWAAEGRGAWMDGRPLRAAPPVALEEMTGSLGFREAKPLLKRRDFGERKGLPARIVRVGCTGLDWRDLACGKLHFAHYGRRLKPWDHAAGVLMHREAGGHSALVGTGAPYRPESGILEAALLGAPDLATWKAICEEILPPH